MPNEPQTNEPIAAQDTSQADPKSPIHRDMLMSEILAQYPQTVEVMMEYGLHCVGCHFNVMDTVEQGCRIHGFSDEQINLLLKDMNAVVVAGSNTQS